MTKSPCQFLLGACWPIQPNTEGTRQPAGRWQQVSALRRCWGPPTIVSVAAACGGRRGWVLALRAADAARGGAGAGARRRRARRRAGPGRPARIMMFLTLLQKPCTLPYFTLSYQRKFLALHSNTQAMCLAFYEQATVYTCRLPVNETTRGTSGCCKLRSSPG